MKRLLALFCVMTCLPVVAFAKDSDEHFYVKNIYGDVNMGYVVKANRSAEHAYMGIRADLSLLNWKNDYKDQDGVKKGSDSFDFKPLLGMDLFAGYRFNENVRADLELGYIGNYSETETEYYYTPEKTYFDLETYYLIANGYYDFKYGLYAGAGIGAALMNVSIDHSAFDKATDTHVSPMWAAMFGWTYGLDDKIDLDVRYRFAMFHGGDVSVNTGGGSYIKTEIGYVIDNSLSVGVRYNF